MRHYDYPRVHPPSSQFLQLQPQPQPQAQSQSQQLSHLDISRQERDDRFSWVATPAEAESRLFQNNTKRRSEVPPLPQIPDHLNPAMEAQTQDVGGYLQDSMQEPASLQPDQKPRTTGRYSAFPSQPTSHAQIPAVSPTPPPEPNPSQQQSQPYHYPEQTKEHPPEPVHEAHLSIYPDANPLTPTTPTTPQHHTNTTNMAIINPQSNDLSHYPLASFTPTAQPRRGGTWTHTFCSCADPTTCLTSVLCPCIIYGRTQYRLGMRSDKKDPTNMLGYNAVNGACVAFGLLCGINGILAAIQHTRVRKTYEMDGEAGNVVGDCIRGCCCCCCVVAQDEKEVRVREEEARRAGGATKSSGREGYVPPGGMTFGPPPR